MSDLKDYKCDYGGCSTCRTLEEQAEYERKLQFGAPSKTGIDAYLENAPPSTLFKLNPPPKTGHTHNAHCGDPACSGLGCGPKPAYNPVSRPSHYAGGKLECIDAIAEAVKGLQGVEAFCIGNAIKYLWRHDMKGGTQDLEKAKWYIDRCISERAKRGAK